MAARKKVAGRQTLASYQQNGYISDTPRPKKRSGPGPRPSKRNTAKKTAAKRAAKKRLY